MPSKIHRTNEAIPVGTKMAFFQAAAPLGWTQDTGHNDKALRVVSGAGGGSGGSLVLSSATVANHALLTSQMPSHQHEVSGRSDVQIGGTVDVMTGVGALTGKNTELVGTGLGHDHGLDLAYVDIIICTRSLSGLTCQDQFTRHN